MNVCRKCHNYLDSRFLFCSHCYQSTKTYKDPKGYVRFKNSNKLLHRYVAEKKLGRSLEIDEVVHHKNRNKTDNKFSNLWVFHSQKIHDWVHRLDARRHGKRASYQGFDKDFY